MDNYHTIEALCKRSYDNAVRHEFHERIPTFGVHGNDTRHILSWLMLITTELAEAAEAARKGDKENFAEELADACIRIFDTCGALGIDLEKAILDKMVFNEKRPIRHGGKLA